MKAANIKSICGKLAALTIAASAAITSVFPMVAHAGRTVYWQQSTAGGYNWNDNANWNTALDGSGEAVVPGEGDTLDFAQLVGTPEGDTRAYYFTNDIPGEVKFDKCVNILTDGEDTKRMQVYFNKGLFWFGDQDAYEFHYCRVGASAKLKADTLTRVKDSGLSHNAYLLLNSGEVEVVNEIVYGIDPISSNKRYSYLFNSGAAGGNVTRINKFKNSEEGRHAMCEAVERIAERREARGVARGKRENMFATAKRMLKDGIIALKDIARYTGLTLVQVKELQASMA